MKHTDTVTSCKDTDSTRFSKDTDTTTSNRHASRNGAASSESLKRRYNLRRLNELPYHLLRCRRTDQLLDEVSLHTMLSHVNTL